METRSPGYTRTSADNFATKLSNWASMFPLPLGPVVPLLGAIGTLMDTAGWLFRGKIGSAATALVAGSASTFVNTMANNSGMGAIYWGNLASNVVTGRSLGTHARKITEIGIGTGTGLLGVQPTVLRSYPAGIGGINGGFASPGRSNGFVAAEAGRRGESSQAAWSRINSSQADHVAQLEAANAQGAQLSR